MKILIFLLLQTVLLSISRDVQLVAADYGRQEQPKKTYIIHMEKSKKPAVFIDHFNWYNSCLTSVSDSANMLYTYTHVIDGFSTSMSEEEAELLKKQPGVVSVIPEIRYEIHTTRSPSFLGLPNKAFSPGSKELSNLVIGVLDSGVWPKSQSYNDKGLGPIPSSWKGECEAGKNFDRSSCNKKLIGARFFYKGYEAHLKHPIDENLESKSPKDDLGHGTHTSSIAAGSAVTDANLFGYASGTATGMAPTARIAIYKAYWRGGSFGADVLAAVEKAIEDGVHIISMSLGSGSRDYYKDNFASATFAAIERGILVTASAGNSGPDAGTLSNIPPWTFTVGAGTIDRDFPASITLGNGKTYKGVSGLYDGKPLQDKLVPLFPGLCLPGSLNPKDVTGKIVICNLEREFSRAKQSLVVKEAGGVGTILTREDVSHGDELKAEADLVPTVAVSLEKGNEIKKYIRSEANPTAKFILEGTKVGVQPSPRVAAFSSRGPNTRTPEILKPDIIAPGVNILAAWPGDLGPSGLDQDKRRVNYNIKSGTSMACPHVSGLAALIKSVHPDWNPAIIRSAMMTTAYTKKNGKTIQDVVTGKAATPFDYGAGHVDPVAALDPGLVYDITVEDYIRFLCALKYTKEQIKIVTRRDFDCNNEKKKYSVGDLNYPSFAVPFKGDGKSTTVTYTRTLTNVGGSPATYKVSVSKVDAVEILVKPQSLTFKKAYEKLTYTVTFTATSGPSLTNRFARLEWSDGKHVVGSPIAFSWSSNFIGNQSYDITMTKNPHNYVLI